MPYQNNDELPDRVKDNLPEHAQDIYREAFNSAVKEYGEDDRAYATAWAAVEKKYHKNEDGEWVENKD